MSSSKQTLYDSKMASAFYQISICRINQLAAARGIEPMRLGGINVWTKAQLIKLKPQANGRPRTKGKNDN